LFSLVAPAARDVLLALLCFKHNQNNNNNNHNNNAPTTTTTTTTQYTDSASGHRFDYSALHNELGDYSATDANGYAYTLNVCGATHNAVCAGQNGTLCQFLPGALQQLQQANADDTAVKVWYHNQENYYIAARVT
jgi:hypothetical protein